MRRVALSVSVNKRERPRAFVRHATATCDLILRRRALPEYGDPLYEKFHREFRSVFFETAPRLTKSLGATLAKSYDRWVRVARS